MPLWNPSFLRSAALNNGGLKGLLFCKCPYGILHFYGLQLSTMKALNAVLLRAPLWIPSVLKPSALNNEGLEGITFIGPLLAACSSKAVSSLLPSMFMLFAALAMHAMCRSSSENTVSSKQSFIFHVFVNCLSISIIKKPA